MHLSLGSMCRTCGANSIHWHENSLARWQSFRKSSLACPINTHLMLTGRVCVWWEYISIDPTYGHEVRTLSVYQYWDSYHRVQLVPFVKFMAVMLIMKNLTWSYTLNSISGDVLYALQRVLYRGIISLKISAKTPHRSPIRARYGV